MKVIVSVNIVDDILRREMELPLSPFNGMQLEVMVDQEVECLEVNQTTYVEKDNIIVLCCDFVDHVLVEDEVHFHELKTRFEQDKRWVFMPNRAPSA